MADARKLKEKATEAFQKGKFVKAAEAYAEYCDADPKDLQARLRMGDAWSKGGKKDKAIHAYTWAAEGFAKDGFLPRAIAASKLILELDPSHKGVQKMLADLYARKTTAPPAASGAARPMSMKIETKVEVQSTAAGFAHRKDAIELDSAPEKKAAPPPPKPNEPPSPMNRKDAIELPAYEAPGAEVGFISQAAEVSKRGPSPMRREDAIEIEEEDTTRKGPADLNEKSIELDVSVTGTQLAAPRPSAPELQVEIEVPIEGSEPVTAPPARSPESFELKVESPVPPPPPPESFELKVEPAAPAPASKVWDLSSDELEVVETTVSEELELVEVLAKPELEVVTQPPARPVLEVVAEPARPAPKPVLEVVSQRPPEPKAASPGELSAQFSITESTGEMSGSFGRPAGEQSGAYALTDMVAEPPRRAEPAGEQSASYALTELAPEQSGSFAKRSPAAEQSGSFGKLRPAAEPPGASATVSPVAEQSASFGKLPPAAEQSGSFGKLPPAAEQSASFAKREPAAEQSGSFAAREPAGEKSGSFSGEKSGSFTAPPGLKPRRPASETPPAAAEPPPPSAPRIWLPGNFAAPVAAAEASPEPAPIAAAFEAPTPESLTDLERGLQIFANFDAEDFKPTRPAVPPPPPAPVAAMPARRTFTELELEGDSLLHAVEAAAAVGVEQRGEAAGHELEEAMEMPDDQKLEPGELPKIPLFSDLPPDAFIALFERCPLKRVEPGDIVIQQGSLGDSFYVICAGSVRVFRMDGEQRREIATLEEGAFFGEMALLSGAARTASVEAATEDTQLLEISAPILTDLSHRYPQVATALKKFCRQRLLSNLMSSASLFQPFSRNDRRELVQRFRARDVARGDILIKEGQRSDGMYVILSGEVEVRVGATQVASLKEGDVFGEMSLLTKANATATVAASKHTSLLRLPREDFDLIIMSHPQVLVLVSELTDARAKENAAIASHRPPRGDAAPMV